MQVKRPPDHITPTGSKFWFRELLYWSNSTGFKTMYLDKDNNLLRLHQGKKGMFRVNVQQLFRDWATKESEEILIDGQEEEKKA